MLKHRLMVFLSATGTSLSTPFQVYEQRSKCVARSYNVLLTDKIVGMLGKKLIPYNNDPFLLDNSWPRPDSSNMNQALTTDIYSEHTAKFVA
jgi:hypothetical protein